MESPFEEGQVPEGAVAPYMERNILNVGSNWVNYISSNY
jgi:hypothetical protein